MMEHTNQRDGRRRRRQTRDDQTAEHSYNDRGYFDPHNQKHGRQMQSQKLLPSRYPVKLGKAGYRHWVICPRCMAEHSGTSRHGVFEYTGGWLTVSAIHQSEFHLHRMAAACGCDVGKIRQCINVRRRVLTFDEVPGTDPADTQTTCYFQHDTLRTWKEADDPRLHQRNYIGLSFAEARLRATRIDDPEEQVAQFEEAFDPKPGLGF